jgi:hypothetical protein
LGVAAGVAIALGPLAARAAAEAPAPLTQLEHVRAALPALAGGADEKAKIAIGSAVIELGSATRESLWIDASDAVPPLDGTKVFEASALAAGELKRIGGDKTVSHEALSGAETEILEAQVDLAEHALTQVQGSGSTPGSALKKWKAAYSQLAKQISKAATSVPQSTVEQAASTYLSSSEDELFAFPQPISGPPLLVGGKPEVFYYGAEGCPFCGIERWSQIVALASFGKFSSVGVTVSSTYDVDPATRTFGFYKSKYSSSYVAFVPVEGFTNQPGGTLTCGEESFPFWTTLQAPTAAEQELISNYDSEEGCLSGLPFMDVANKWSTIGSTANPEVIAGMSWQQIAGALSNPSSPVGQDIDGGAEIINAQICEADGQQPARVCNSSVVKQYEEQIRSGPPPPPH